MSVAVALILSCFIMGVKHLWTFLSPVKKEVTIESLNGQIIAVDLSIWIMEAQTHLPKHVAKPHLRFLNFDFLIHLSKVMDNLS